MSELIKNIVLVGRIGNGKSATGNTLLGEKMFESEEKAVGVTMKCKMYRTAIQDGPIINVIDTPGFVNSVMFEELSKEIINCLTMTKEGIHAVLLVLSVKNRVSQEEESAINTLQRIFGSKIFDYVIIVFTGADKFEEDKQILDDIFGASCPEFLTNALKLCCGRKVMFNNITTDKNKKAEQLKQLLDLVADVEKQTGGMPYTNQMHRNIKEKNDEKVREQERINESKKRVEALMHEKLRMDQEMIALMEESKMRMELQRAIESKNRAEAELAVTRETLRMTNEKLQMEKEKTRQFAKICIVYARDLSIAWSDDTSYWSWLPLRNETSSNSLVEAAVLRAVCWLSVNGNFDTVELTPETTYEVVYVVKLEDSASGWETPVNLKLTLPNSRARPQERSVSLKEHMGKQWVYIKAGEFMTSAEDTGEISFSLYETEACSWKSGLYVKWVEIRPKI